MGEKVTIMVLKVDLQCPCCYKKVKKIICKFPQIRDQVYKEKENKVVITVVCCNPEKIRDKLCCKGAKVIKSIEILDPPKPEPEKPKSNNPEKPKPEPEKPKPNNPENSKPDKKVTFKDPPENSEKPKPAPKQEQPKPPASPVPIPIPVPAPTPAPAPPPPILGPGPCEYPPISPGRNCCGPCSQGYGGGPCYFGHGPPPPPMPQPCFDGYYAYGCHDRPCHVTRCDYYFSEENPQACSIM
ncbi:protein PYRICULARIA ORYZAE RESISTANCE 21-like isoform X4 [Salvia hispanica]|uniref:protein PYRICULARIA ORYZAE RESISTANCE 21-like isoform X4 n=1 Tax=Salvia hispanica TaxID=49212 RepID=UPI00200941A3|nr:protein PYRICULARIA ORYZAE RESISTANCE 21-like isoform X4 [Salvia hispanica]XP_047955694.1 protein PYRICULARIA ORYZAE RESISTANCE 21-like isoform X4 [Salvia hispanica]